MPKKLICLAPVLILALSAASAFAEDSEIDARTVGYPPNTKVGFEPPSTSGAWFALAGLGVLAFGPLFVNPNRTHLD